MSLAELVHVRCVYCQSQHNQTTPYFTGFFAIFWFTLSRPQGDPRLLPATAPVDPRSCSLPLKAVSSASICLAQSVLVEEAGVSGLDRVAFLLMPCRRSKI